MENKNTAALAKAAEVALTSGSHYFLRAPLPYILVTGHLNAAVLLDRIAYWSGKYTRNEGWFYKKIQEWQNDLFLGRFEFRAASQRLQELGLIQVEKRNKGNTLYYRLHPEFSQRMGAAVVRVCEEKGVALDHIFDTPEVQQFVEESIEDKSTETERLRKTRVRKPNAIEGARVRKPNANGKRLHKQKNNTTRTRDKLGALESVNGDNSATTPSNGFGLVHTPKKTKGQRLAIKLENYIRRARNLLNVPNTDGWDAEMDNLVDSVGCAKRIYAVMQWWFANRHNPYTPQIHSAGTFADKFLPLESAMKRQKQNKPFDPNNDTTYFNKELNKELTIRPWMRKYKVEELLKNKPYDCVHPYFRKFTHQPLIIAERGLDYILAMKPKTKKEYMAERAYAISQGYSGEELGEGTVLPLQPQNPEE